MDLRGKKIRKITVVTGYGVERLPVLTTVSVLSTASKD